MIPAIVAALSFVTIIVTTSILIAKGADLKKQYDDRLRMMTDQVNNAQYYNASVDKKTNEDLKDVRKTYTSKDEIARKVDTKELSAGKASATDITAKSLKGDVLNVEKSTADSMRVNKLIMPGGVVGALDVGKLNTSEVNLYGSKDGKGYLNFGDGATMRKDSVGDDVVLKGGMKFDGASPVTIKPTTGEMNFNNKWSMGVLKNKAAETQGLKYSALGTSFDNKEFVGMYKIGDTNFTRFNSLIDVTSADNSWLSLTADTGDSIYMGTNSMGKGIASLGEKPFEIYASEFKTGQASVAGVQFNDGELKNVEEPGFINNKDFVIVGKGKNKNIVMQENVYVKGVSGGKVLKADEKVSAGDGAWMTSTGHVQGTNVVASSLSSGLNVQGLDNVTAGEWAAVMRKDGSIQGKVVNASEWTSGKGVQGRENVVAGDWAAVMKSDGSVVGKSINSTGVSSGQTVQGRDFVTAGEMKAVMRADGSIAGRSGSFSDALNVGSASLMKDGTISGKKLLVNEITPQVGGFSITNGPFKVSATVPIGVDGAAGPNKRLYVAPDGKVGVGTDKPGTTLDVAGNVYVKGISTPKGSPDMMRINYENNLVPNGSRIGLYNGVNVAGGGGMYVGAFDKKVPDGTIEATGKVVAPSFSTKPGSSQYMYLNLDNRAVSANPGVALINGAVVAGGGGLTVGAYEKAPEGTVAAKGKVVTPVVQASSSIQAPIGKIDRVVSGVVTQAAGAQDWLRINQDNVNNSVNMGVALLNGTAVTGGGGLTVGAWNKAPEGVLDVRGQVLTPAISRKAGDTDWLRINNLNGANAANMGTAVTGALSVGGGITSGSFKKVPSGTLEVSGKMCVNAACLTEDDIKKVKARLAIS